MSKVKTTLGPFAKALVPAVAALLGVIVNTLIAGSFDKVSLATAITGVVMAALTYFVPNVKPAAVAVPVPPAPVVVKPPVVPVVPKPPVAKPIVKMVPAPKPAAIKPPKRVPVQKPASLAAKPVSVKKPPPAK